MKKIIFLAIMASIGFLLFHTMAISENYIKKGEADMKLMEKSKTVRQYIITMYDENEKHNFSDAVDGMIISSIARRLSSNIKMKNENLSVEGKNSLTTHDKYGISVQLERIIIK